MLLTTRCESPRAPNRSSATSRLRTRKSIGVASDCGGVAGSSLGTQSSVAVRAVTRSKSNKRCRQRNSYGSTAISAACSDQVGPLTDRLRAVNPSRSDPETSLTVTDVFNRELSSTTKRNPLGVVYIHQIAATLPTTISSDPTSSPKSSVIQRERRRGVAFCDGFTFVRSARTRSRPRSADEPACRARRRRHRQRAVRPTCASARPFQHRPRPSFP